MVSTILRKENLICPRLLCDVESILCILYNCGFMNFIWGMKIVISNRSIYIPIFGLCLLLIGDWIKRKLYSGEIESFLYPKQSDLINIFPDSART